MTAGICRGGQHGLSIRSHVERLTYARRTTEAPEAVLGLRFYANARLSDPAHTVGGTCALPCAESSGTLVAVPCPARPPGVSLDSVLRSARYRLCRKGLKQFQTAQITQLATRSPTLFSFLFPNLCYFLPIADWTSWTG